jgi:hypothetical protein
MSYSVASLQVFVPKQVAHWQKEILTENETIGGIFEEFLLTLTENPAASEVVIDLLDTLPKTFPAKMIERFQQYERPDGGWNWPPYSSTLVDYAPGAPPVERPPNKIATPKQQEAIYRLQDCLRRLTPR